MTLFAGLDVSVRETSVCVIDAAGKVLAERKVATEPDDLIELLRSISSEYGRIGLEAGPLSQWLVNGLADAGLPVVSQERRMLLTSRKLLQRKLLDVEADLRGTLRNFGLKVGVVSTGGFEARIRELVEGFHRLAAIVESMLAVRKVLREQFAVLHRMLLVLVRHDPLWRSPTAPLSISPSASSTPRRWGRAPV